MKLRDSGLTVADPAEDVRGHKAVDRDGEEIGKVTDLYIDEEERRARFLEVESGGFLGIGGESRLIPVDAVTGVDEDTVRIGATRQRVHASPRYDPELAEQAEYWEGAYGYYESVPFWGAGYVHPPYPYYRDAPAGRGD
ncbi:MAG: PRC-barrel domain-containing protein [Gaiella sp.]